jgi:hypothetical protein
VITASASIAHATVISAVTWAKRIGNGQAACDIDLMAISVSLMIDMCIV